MSGISSFREKLLSLVSKFDKDKNHYLSKGYPEAQVRIDFLNPLFEALGWDIENKAHKPPHERDVIVELSPETTKRPDYNFRVRGATKFFVEAKSPSESLDNINHILQAKTYAWSTKEVFFVVLTDFEEFRLYDASLKPNPKYPDEGLILKLEYTDYLDNVEKLYELSRERVLEGSLEALLPKDAKSKRLRIPPDKSFLEDLTGWRTELAKDIYKRNPEFDVRLLNDVVQKLLDRLIFVRIAEDRRIRPERELWEIAAQWREEGKRKSIMTHLIDLFHEVNDDLNGDIFKPHACEKADVDSELLAEIIENLYFPKSRYRFDAIGVELLGSIYERYLGSTIRVTPQRVKVEEKPEVRKAGGVYYTPKYIVDYIVKNTVGRLIEGKSPKQIEKIRILDPACGSGSFLLGAYQYLIDYHIEWYRKHPKDMLTMEHPYFKRDVLEEGLSIHEKAKILRNNLYGVDIDPQAVEITMMSLYLKALEGERGRLPKKQHLLPPLSENIKCGNSLIGYDIYEDLFTPPTKPPLAKEGSITPPSPPLNLRGGREGLFDDDTKSRINPFDWTSKSTGFGEIMEAGGFDAVIGNPPYGALFGKIEIDYLRNEYKAFRGVQDVYPCFVENNLKHLNNSGRFSFIMPTAWLGGPEYKNLREIFLVNKIETLILLPFDVFADAYIDTAIFVVSKQKITAKHNVRIYIYGKREKLDNINLSEGDYKRTRQNAWRKSEDKKFILDPAALSLIEGINARTSKVLGDYIDFKRGVLFDRKLLASNKTSAICHPYFEGDVYRYELNYVAPHWVEFNDKMKERPKDFIWFDVPRILLRRLVNRRQRLMATFTDKTFITNKNLYSLINKDRDTNLFFVLGILNSRLIAYLYINMVTQAVKDDFPQVTIKDVQKLPYPVIQNTNNLHDRIVSLVNRMLELHKKKASMPPSAERAKVEREIAITDEKIDEIVYELYGITDEERGIIENVSK